MPGRRGEPEGRLRPRAERRALPRELPHRALCERPPGAGESGTEPEAAAPRGRDAADRREAHDGRAHPGAAPHPPPERLDQGAGRARQGQEHPRPPRNNPQARSRPRSPRSPGLGPGTPVFRPAPLREGLERRPPVGTPAVGGRKRVSPTEKKRGDGLERRPPVGTARRRRAKPRIADREKARGRLGTPTSGRHAPAQRAQPRRATGAEARTTAGLHRPGR